MQRKITASRADIRVINSRQWEQPVSMENYQKSAEWAINDTLKKLDEFLRDLWL
jgi:hypothetical protein